MSQKVAHQELYEKTPNLGDFFIRGTISRGLAFLRSRSVHSSAYQILARYLKMARLNPPDGRKKLTQVEIAQKLGKPRSYTFKVENAERELNVIELVDYCEALGVDFFEFMRNYLREVESSRKTPQPKEDSID